MLGEGNMISNSKKDTSKSQLLLIRYQMDQVTGHFLCCITHLGTLVTNLSCYVQKSTAMVQPIFL